MTASARYRPEPDDRQEAATQLRLLGAFSLEQAGRSVSLAGALQRLVALLGLRGATSRSFVAGSLWPNVSESRANGSLRTSLWRLRRAGVDVIIAGSDSVALSPRVETDVSTVTAWAYGLIDGEPTEWDLHPPGPVTADLLPGWYEEWVLGERERLHQLKLHALEILAALLGERGHYAAAIDTALQVIQLEPLRESPRRTLIALHFAEGNFCEAARQDREYRDLLRVELGVEPSRQFADLSARLYA